MKQYFGNPEDYFEVKKEIESEITEQKKPNEQKEIGKENEISQEKLDERTERDSRMGLNLY